MTVIWNPATWIPDHPFAGWNSGAPGQSPFAKGGRRGLWASRNVRDCLRLVVCAALIDALSHLALYLDAADALWPLGYVATGGSLGKRSRELLAYLFAQAAESGGAVHCTLKHRKPLGHFTAHSVSEL